VGRGLILEYSASLDYSYTPQSMDVVKSHNDLAVTIQRNSSNVVHAPQESSQVCWYFLWKSSSEIMCSHQWWQEMK